MKKHTLRILSLILTLGLCLGLGGCAPADERAFERACALLEDGEYEAAIEALEAIGLYQQIDEKIEEAHAKLAEEKAEFLRGEWVDVYSGAVFTFSRGGKGSSTLYEYAQDFTYTTDGQTVEIRGETLVVLNVTKEDGVFRLRDDLDSVHLITSEYYDSLLPQTIEITMENWEDYFYHKPAQDVGADENGVINHREMGYGIFLKEEFIPRINYEAGGYDLCFYVEYVYTPYLVEGELDSDSYSLTPTLMPVELEYLEGTQFAMEYVSDRGSQLWQTEDSDLSGAVCAFLGAVEYAQDDQNYLLQVEQVQITGVQGTLILNP